MSRIKDLPLATAPAVDDSLVLDGPTAGVRRIVAGSAIARNVPATGNAASDEVVLGSDTRLSVVGGGPGATALSALTDVELVDVENDDILQFQTSGSRWKNRKPELITDGGNF